MDRDKLRAIEWDCSQTVIRMGYHLDVGEFEEFASYFKEDGFWMKRGRPLQGRQAIIDDCAARPPHLRIRHVFTNFVVDLVDETHATCRCYMSGRRALLQEPIEGMVPADDTALWIYHDEMELTDKGWKVTKRIQERVFENPLPSA